MDTGENERLQSWNFRKFAKILKTSIDVKHRVTDSHSGGEARRCCLCGYAAAAAAAAAATE